MSCCRRRSKYWTLEVSRNKVNKFAISDSAARGRINKAGELVTLNSLPYRTPKGNGILPRLQFNRTLP